MRHVVPFSIAIVLLLSTATAAQYDAIELGDTVTGTIVAGDISVIPFQGLAGTQVKLTLKADQGSFPDFAILEPEALGRAPLALLDTKKLDTKKGKSASVKKLPLPGTGVYHLILTAQVTTEFSLKTSGKLLKKLSVSPLIPITAPDIRVVGSMPGSILSYSIKAGKGSELDPEIVELRSHPGGVPWEHDDLPPDFNPDGDDVDFSQASQKVKTGQHSFSKMPLPAFGDVTIHAWARVGSAGGPATIKVKLKHPKPRKLSIMLSEIDLEPRVDLLLPGQAFDNNGGGGVTEQTLVVSGAFFRQDASLRLENDLGETIAPATITRVNHMTLRADFDFRAVAEAIQRGDFDLIVSQRLSDPGREETGVLEAGFRLDRAPVATSISDTVFWDGKLYGETPVTLTGKYFSGEVQVTFSRGVPGGEPTATTIKVAPTALTFPLNSWNSTPGTYTITVTNGDGGTTTLPGTIEVLTGPTGTLIDASGVFDNDTLTGVTLTGADLIDTPTITFVHQTDGDVIDATNEALVSSTSMTFDVSAVGARLGFYDLFVANPDGGRDVVRFALLVSRAPVLTGVSPIRAFSGETLDPFDIMGDWFEQGSKAELSLGTEILKPDSLIFQTNKLLRGTLDLTDATHGSWGLTVTNPSDGGTDFLPDALHIFGTFGLVEDETGATGPIVVRDDVRDEHFVVYTLENATGDHDIRAVRISADTGDTVAEIKVTETSGTNERDPALVYDPDGDRFIIVYVSGGKALKLAEITGGATTVKTTLTLSSGSKTLSNPSVAYNGDDGEFLTVFESGGDIPAVRVPTTGGLSESSLSEFTVLYFSGHPYVAWSSTDDLYIIAFQQDADEGALNPPPPDTGMDVSLVHLASGETTIDHQTGESVTATADNDVRPKFVWNTEDDELLIYWEREVSGSNRDVYARRYDPSAGSFVASAVQIEDESSATVDATGVSVVWDADASVFLFAYAAGGTDIAITETSGTLGNATHVTAVSGETGDTLSAPSIGAREKDGEVLLLFEIDASSEPDRQIEGRFRR